MKIANSTIELTSSRTSVEYYHKEESLTMWRQGTALSRSEQVDAEGDQLQAKALEAADEAAKVSLSEAGQQAATAVTAESAEVRASLEDAELLDDLNIRVLRSFFEKITGRKFRMFNHGAIQKAMHAAKASEVSTEPRAGAQRQGWGVEYRKQEIYHESESTQFTAQGVIQTADGKEIQIGIEVNMNRSFTTGKEELLQLGDAKLKDPLVVNFGGNATQLTQEKYSFDIDADGSEDQISFVTSGSGFLALDANEDGQINDGSELFGAQSGNGFGDLAKYDEDGNGWIDESDSIYEKLRIWTKNGAGEDQLLALGEKNIGALYLGNVDSAFSIKNTEDNALQGQVRSSGIFLFEDGRVGSMQQLDLVA
ncbi:hypothetical protein JWJ90_00515 [Desulfobulbus rhabdoformis]|uniref:hypothetical protein n=1 Tax=Desulfobulbus rhabdoformis TaxID=34032 RepID=UPI001966B3BB|nr:hypothetical protein [Desulfobulbus rhabdoformis]MBM9612762.1 hypothetical protein [Desulfobulbus rhabdoformis]